MEIGAFIAPSSGFLDTYSKANFNTYNLVLTPSSFADSSVIARTKTTINYVMNKCAELGIDAQIQLHHDLISASYGNVFTEYLSDVNFKSYPAFKGFYLCDEPTWTQIDVLDDYYVSWFNTNYGNSDIEFYVNMLGGYSSAIGAIKDANGNYVYVNGQKIYSGTEEQERVCYDYYVKQFMEMFAKVQSNNKFFTIDHYALLDNQTGLLTIPSEDYRDEYVNGQGVANSDILIADNLPDGYQYVLSKNFLNSTYKAALNAKNNGYAFGAFIQACDESGTRTFRLPTTIEEIKWQVYTNIAFGAKKLTYYGYDNSIGGTYMTLSGNPLPLYELVKETNAELDKVDHVFAAFDKWVGVKTFLGASSTENVAFSRISNVELDALTGVSNVTTSKDLIVGEMVDGSGNHGYMFVGYDDPINKTETQVSLTFDGAEGLIIYRNGERTLSNALVNGAYSFTLSAGEGVFVIPVYA